MRGIITGFLGLDKTRLGDVEKAGWPEVVVDPTFELKGYV
jgi:hypothetical protein